MKIIIFVIFFGFPYFSFANEISLQCEGETQYLSWGSKKWIAYKKNFEIFFDENQKSLSWQGISWCGVFEKNTDSFEITKNSISYKCAATNTNENDLPDKINGWFSLSRNTGKIKWGLFMTSKRNKDEFFTENGEGSCNLGVKKF